MKHNWLDTRLNLWKTALLAVFLGFAGYLIKEISEMTISETWVWWFAGLATLVSIQAGLFLYWILYAWNDPDEVERNKSPEDYSEPKKSFTALLAVRHEENVIGDTIEAIAKIDYPENKKELLVLIRPDDRKTIEAVERAMHVIKPANTRIILVDDLPVNKPNQLNWGLRQAKNEVVVVFDAEDQPHKDIYHIVNTVMENKQADVVQCGVQLVNYNSSWFSALNCLEYYFWFKSALHFFAKRGVVPLGGNTVFFKRAWLNLVDGWDEQCLTEDGDIGIRLSLAGAKTVIAYDERHATQEETPDSVGAFVKQRTRWNLGFLQILFKGQWLKFPSWRQRLLAAYLLILPELLGTMLLLTPLLTAVALTVSLPLPIAIISFVPMGFLMIQVAVLVVGLWVFARSYKAGWPVMASLFVVGGFVPYVILLAIGSVRGMIRLASKDLRWEKTLHVNVHRKNMAYATNQ